jgi:hypothetical protein
LSGERDDRVIAADLKAHLPRKPLHAKAFYGAIAVATLLGAAANVFALNPVKALVWAAVLNGIVAVPSWCC